jgi:alpha-L-fucosidase
MENAYESDWESLDSRRCPKWFEAAKFGIFIHWGVYSVPAWAPKRRDVNDNGAAYAEWYGAAMQDSANPIAQFHAKTFGKDFPYRDFAPRFSAEVFDPDRWARLFRSAGARYVVLTSKHHDGYCLWPSKYSPDWNSVDVGPKRDLVKDLGEAVRKEDMRFGLYYSLLEWYHDLYKSDPERYALDHMIPQMKELIEAYKPDLLYADGEWDHPSSTWHSADFLAWLFNESPVAREIVVNDRWGKETRSAHGGFFTSEYGEVGFDKELGAGRVWEEIRSIGASFGYNRNENLEDYLGENDLINLLVDTVLEGGNLCLNVGPTADGRVPVLMEERLLQIGHWLKVNGEGIYGGRPWGQGGEEEAEEQVRYLEHDGILYAFFSSWPRGEAELRVPLIWKGTPSVHLLGDGVPLSCRRDGQQVTVNTRGIPQRGIPARAPFVFKMEGAPSES